MPRSSDESSLALPLPPVATQSAPPADNAAVESSSLALPDAPAGTESATQPENLTVGSSTLALSPPRDGIQSATQAKDTAVGSASAQANAQETPFKNCCVAICGHHEPLKTDALKAMVIGLGAKYSRIVRASTTHLITTEREIDNEAKQVVRSRDVQTCEVVSLPWLLDSRDAGRPLPASRYRLVKPTPLAAEPNTNEAIAPRHGQVARPETHEDESEDAPERPNKHRKIRHARDEAEVQAQAQTVAATAEAHPTPVPEHAQPQAAVRTAYAVQTAHYEAAINNSINNWHLPGWRSAGPQPIHHNVHAAANLTAVPGPQPTRSYHNQAMLNPFPAHHPEPAWRQGAQQRIHNHNAAGNRMQILGGPLHPRFNGRTVWPQGTHQPFYYYGDEENHVPNPVPVPAPVPANPFARRAFEWLRQNRDRNRNQ
ncbi:hypothetical protein ASPCAL13199 [Aspergillus calidoustus]|uniref:BRCT domain-containing protein n=1 Tax=Aspergillus calidoustus TaxID=454130 RepID=A0A0U5GGU5_ASPCI|nr:hypothetical protein ASPCAL13199 [Aspergillus calidoustus]